jgi:Zn-dependent alcohol dehydrogenase
LTRLAPALTRASPDFPWLVREYLEGRLEVDEQINDAFAGMANGAVVRAVLTLN